MILSPTGHEYPPLPDWAFPVFEFINVLLLALPTSQWLSISGVAFQTGFVAYLFSTYHMPNPAQAYTMACFFIFKVLYLAAWTLLKDLKKEVREVELDFDEQGKEVRQEGAFPGSYSLPRRMLWSWLGATWNPRGIGYSNQVKGVSPIPKDLLRSRWKFVASRLKTVFWTYLVMDLCETWTHHINPKPFQTMGSVSLTHASQSSFQKWMNVTAFAMMTGAGLTLPHAIASALLVALHLGKPQSYPHILGSLKSAYTVRKLWGETWHQILRQLLATWGKWVTTKLHFKAGTNASSYTQLYVAFFISGLIHSGGDLMSLGKSSIGVSMPFFLKQAVAITLEDFVIWLGRRTVGQPRWAPWVGYCWVICWFRWSLPGWYDILMRGGAGTEKTIAFSICTPLWKIVRSYSNN